MRWLAVRFPALPMERFGVKQNSFPLAVVEQQQGKQKILQSNQVAKDAGVHAGQSLSAARALSFDLTVLQRDTDREAEVLQRLAVWAMQFSSQVSIELPDTLVIEQAASWKLFGGIRPLIHQFRQELQQIEYAALLAVAPTATAAIALVRAGVEVVVDTQQTLGSHLQQLPLYVAPLDRRQQHLLQRMGVQHCRALMDLPLDGVRRRFGEALVLWRQRMLGQQAELRQWIQAPAEFHARLELPAEVEVVEGLLFACRRLLNELGGYLRAGQWVTAELQWRLRYRKGIERFQLRLQQPSCDPEKFLALLKMRFERLILESPVSEIELYVDHLIRSGGDAVDWIDGSNHRGVNLLETLKVRLGQEAVMGICQQPDHRPEKAMATCEPGVGKMMRSSFPARPLWLLPEPQQLQVVQGRPFFKGELRLEHERERIVSGWWDDELVCRDYFVAWTGKGEKLWVYLDQQQRDKKNHCWFLHGLFG